jgi:hypothetical protein
VKNSFHIGGYVQVYAFHPRHGATLLGTCPPDTDWRNYEFFHSGDADEIRFYLVDITDRNSLYLDGIELEAGYCEPGPAAVPSATRIGLIILLLIAGPALLVTIMYGTLIRR